MDSNFSGGFKLKLINNNLSPTICCENIVNVVLFYFIWVFFFWQFSRKKYFVLNDTMSFISVSNLINESHVCKKNY